MNINRNILYYNLLYFLVFLWEHNNNHCNLYLKYDGHNLNNFCHFLCSNYMNYVFSMSDFVKIYYCLIEKTFFYLLLSFFWNINLDDILMIVEMSFDFVCSLKKLDLICYIYFFGTYQKFKFIF